MHQHLNVPNYSKCFTKTERRYCVTRRVLLSIINGIIFSHHYIHGRHVIIRTDHFIIKWLLNFKNVESQLARWLTFLSAFDSQLNIEVAGYIQILMHCLDVHV